MSAPLPLPPEPSPGMIEAYSDFMGYWVQVSFVVLFLGIAMTFIRLMCSYLGFKDHQKPTPEKEKAPDPAQQMDATIRSMPYKDREWMREQTRKVGL